MTTLVAILRFITIFCAGVGSASLWTILIVAVPIARRIPSPGGLFIRQNIDPLMDRFNPICVGLAAVAGIVILILHHNLSTASGVFTVIGVVSMLGIIGISLRLAAPITHRLATLSPESAATELPTLAEQWDRFQALRTACGLIGFASFVIASLT